MEGINLFCEVDNCGKAAQAFGLKGHTKVRCCSDHMPELVKKKMTIHDIVAFPFISSYEDAGIYEERRLQTEKGLGTLVALDAAIDIELQASKPRIESAKAEVIATVERCFNEVRSRVEQRAEELKDQLAALRRGYEDYLSAREVELSPVALFLCGEIEVSPRFLRLHIDAPIVPIAEVIVESWTVATTSAEELLALITPANIEKFLSSLATDAVRNHNPASLDYAKSLGYTDDSDRAQTAISQYIAKKQQELASILVASIDEQSAKTATDTLVAKGRQAAAGKDFAEAAKQMRTAWDVRRRFGSSDPETVAIVLELADTLTLKLGRFAEAEKVLKDCLELVAKRDRLSECAMHLQVSIASVYFHSNRDKDSARLSSSLLEAFSDEDHPAELFWTALFYLTYSFDFAGPSQSIASVVEEWREIPMKGQNRRTEVMKDLILGWVAMHESSQVEAERHFLAAVEQAETHCAETVLGALCHYFFSLFAEAREQPEEALAHIDRAQSLLSVHAPFSIYRANALMSLSTMHSSDPAKALHYFESTQTTLDSIAPLSLDAAANLTNWSNLLKKERRWKEAESGYLRAIKVYEAAAPRSEEAACNLAEIADMYEEMGRISDAITYYSQCHRLFSQLQHSLGTARCQDCLHRLKSQVPSVPH